MSLAILRKKGKRNCWEKIEKMIDNGVYCLSFLNKKKRSFFFGHLLEENTVRNVTSFSRPILKTKVVTVKRAKNMAAELGIDEKKPRIDPEFYQL